MSKRLFSNRPALFFVQVVFSIFPCAYRRRLICAICKAQFTKVLPYYKFPMDMIQSVHGLVSKAIQLTAPK